MQTLLNATHIPAPPRLPPPLLLLPQSDLLLFLRPTHWETGRVWLDSGGEPEAERGVLQEVADAGRGDAEAVHHHGACIGRLIAVKDSFFSNGH